MMRQVILIPDPDGGYVVEVPSLPGCYSQGNTMDEALDNVREAIAVHIESMIAHGEDVPEGFAAHWFHGGSTTRQPYHLDS